MHSFADELPSDIAHQVHPDWRKNETDYWQVRDGLLTQYQNQWIAFADGKVIAFGPSPAEVFQKAQQSGRHPFVVSVGREHEPTRMRRAEFAYDSEYPDEALPVVTVEFRKDVSAVGVVMD